jgi:transcriptional regulator GlxA family with amidase domain
MTVGAVTERIGCESEAAFSKAFKRHLGLPPSAYRGQPSRVA